MTGLDAWRRRTAAGAVLTGIALGLREALDPREGRALVLETAGDPPGRAAPLELHFDGRRPHETWVVVRPWLLPERRR